MSKNSQNQQSNIGAVNRSAYEIELYEKVKDVYDDAQKLIDGWNRLKDLQYSSEHRALFGAMESFVRHCG
jgi:hypothetical protein